MCKAKKGEAKLHAECDLNCEVERGDAQIVLKTSERTARNTLSKLTAAGYLTSASPKTPVRLAFPLDYRERLFPNLFGDGDLP